MRLSVQGCLILVLCLLSLQVYARTRSEAMALCESERLSLASDYTGTCGEGTVFGRPAIRLLVVYADSGESYTSIPWEYNPNEQCSLSHETGGPDFLGCPDTCAAGYTSDSSGQSGFNCVVLEDPGQCYEVGQAYDSQNQTCTDVCENGVLNGVCLNPSPNNEDVCNPERDDYQGYIGNGSNRFNVCSSDTQCDTGQFGVVNGVPACIPDEYGPPTCGSAETAVIDEYGFVCESNKDAPEEDPQPDPDPNTDTDGDGEPDVYNPDNDPNIQRKQNDQLLDEQKQSNKSLSNLENLSKGANNRLDDINAGVSELVEMGRNGDLAGGAGEGLQDAEGNDYLAGIEENTKATADALSDPDGGFDTSGLGTSPDFSVSVARLKGVIFDHPTIQSVSTLPTLGTSTSCPTYTIPATDFWQPLLMDIHCDILEQYRSVFSAMFLFFWTVVAIFLFLRA